MWPSAHACLWQVLPAGHLDCGGPAWGMGQKGFGHCESQVTELNPGLVFQPQLSVFAGWTSAPVSEDSTWTLCPLSTPLDGLGIVFPAPLYNGESCQSPYFPRPCSFSWTWLWACQLSCLCRGFDAPLTYLPGFCSCSAGQSHSIPTGNAAVALAWGPRKKAHTQSAALCATLYCCWTRYRVLPHLRREVD